MRPFFCAMLKGMTISELLILIPLIALGWAIRRKIARAIWRNLWR